MIKIIYGVTDKSFTCELIFPKQDDVESLALVRISRLVNKSIIKDNTPESTVGEQFYSIHCISDFYVFSKINIVCDIDKRVSYRAYIIALKKTKLIVMCGKKYRI